MGDVRYGTVTHPQVIVRCPIGLGAREDGQTIHFVLYKVITEFTPKCQPRSAPTSTFTDVFVLTIKPGPRRPTTASHFKMSDDDDILSIDTVPGPGLTEELRALHQKMHDERTDRMFVGRILWPLPSPEPPKRRTRRMLVGLANPFPDHGLKRSPTGRVRSWRLETQRRKEAASKPPAKRGGRQKRSGRGKGPSSKASKNGRGNKKAAATSRTARRAK